MSIVAEGVTVVRGNRRLLDRVSLQVRCGEVLCLLGPNGAGKSTLVGALAGDIQLHDGRILCDRRDLADVSDLAQARIRSVMSQTAAPVFGFTVEDVVGMGWIGDGDFRSAEAGRVTRARLNDCGIAHLAGRTFNTLSGGEQQRAHFARSLVQIWRRNGDCRPRYLLLDEPTSNLDLVHQQRILELARRQARNGIGVMVVLHDLNLAARYADRVALLKAGRLVCCGPMVEALNATVLSDTYETDVHVEHHHKLGRLVVLT